MNDLNRRIWQAHPRYQQLKAKLSQRIPVQVSGLAAPAQSSFLASLIEDSPVAPVLIQSNQSSNSQLNKLAQGIQRLLKPGRAVQVLSGSTHFLPKGVTESPQHFLRVAGLLSQLKAGEPLVLVASPGALLSPLPPPETIVSCALAVGQEIQLSALLEQLVALGYRRSDNVLEVGNFALRGDILDIFPSNRLDRLPLRINFFGDQIENIRPFEPWTQRSIPGEDLPEILIGPGQLFDLASVDLASLEALAEELEESQRVFWLEDLQRLEEGEWPRFTPWLNERFASLIDFFPEDSLLIVEELSSLGSQLEQICANWSGELNQLLARRALPPSQRERLSHFVDSPLLALERLNERHQVELSFAATALAT